MGTVCVSRNIVYRGKTDLWDLELALALAKEDLLLASQNGGSIPFSKKTTSKVLQRRIANLERKILVLQSRIRKTPDPTQLHRVA